MSDVIKGEGKPVNVLAEMAEATGTRFPPCNIKMLLDTRLNAFAVELLVESIQRLQVGHGLMEKPFTFTFRGVEISVRKVAEDERINRQAAKDADNGHTPKTT